MKRFQLTVFIALIGLWLVPASLIAAPDQFLGDSGIYSGDTAKVRPNVVILIDTSKNMEQGGGTEPYDKNTTYTGTYTPNRVYKQLNASQFQDTGVDVSSMSCAAAKLALQEYGFTNNPLNGGACGTKKSHEGNFYLGNLLNKTQSSPPAPTTWAANTAYTVGTVVKSTSSTNTNTYRCVQAGTSAATQPVWPVVAGGRVTDGGVVWEITSTLMDVMKVVLKQVAGALRNDVRLGLMTVGPNNAGGYVRAEAKDMAPTDTGGDTNYNALVSAIDNLSVISSNTSQPANETLYDAMKYYKGENGSNTKLASGAAVFTAPSPIQYTCQRNYAIVLTTGSSTPSSQAANAVGDQNGDTRPGRIDDVAKLLYKTDMFTGMKDEARVRTSVIQLMTSYVEELDQATDPNHGNGSYALANSTEEITKALLDLMVNIVLEVDTAFVAPAIPASPENRTYSGSRVYLGFFKPQTQMPWLGNLKKFAINSSNQIVDKNGAAATNSDGSFSATAVSYWNDDVDAGAVDKGGVGQRLQARDFTTDPRNIYSNLTTTADLTVSGNQFVKTNTNLTTTALGVSTDTEKNQLVDYIRGIDAYDENANGSSTDKRAWMFGDIRHSRPAVVNYAPFNLSNESNCSINKTMVFVGTNDGMFHAFNDCNGEEAWAFVPDIVLPNLKEMAARPAAVNYFVDAAPVVMRYDANRDGTVDSSTDKVVVIFGLRRGGSAYYALDVTTPASPKLLWKYDASTTGFGNLGESWSDPQFAKVRVGSESKLVAFFGAGYDINEDGRFGATGTFPAIITQAQGNGNVTSSGATAVESRPTPVGRGVYALNIASLSSGGAPTMVSSPSKLWEYNSSTNTAMQYPFPTDITVVDTDSDGYADKVYAADTGGRLWRFNVKDSSTSNWTGNIIFSAGSSSGRKVFYRPAVSVEKDYTMVALGTGDREHPLNLAVVDRMYLIKDRGQTSANNITESNLLDVTTNELQGASTSTTRQDELLATLASSSNYGWFIRLPNVGEKVLASPLLLNKMAFFTTYTPNTVIVSDPCSPGNLGTSRLYVLNYLTGEAALNFASSNDNQAGSMANKRALDKDGKVILTEDRVSTLGSGIPSGITVILPQNGEISAMIGSGAGVKVTHTKQSNLSKIINWLQW